LTRFINVAIFTTELQLLARDRVASDEPDSVGILRWSKAVISTSGRNENSKWERRLGEIVDNRKKNQK
jgi:hypothetical protein